MAPLYSPKVCDKGNTGGGEIGLHAEPTLLGFGNAERVKMEAVLRRLFPGVDVADILPGRLDIRGEPIAP